MIKNYMEELVDEIYMEMKYLIVDCDTRKCEHNIKSMALNQLPPAYFDYNASKADIKSYLLDRQRRTSVLAKLAEASSVLCAECKLK